MAAAASILLISSTASVTIISEPSEPPYCSGTSIPMRPISKYCFTRAGSILPARSIACTRGFTSSAAKAATASRNAVSSSERTVSGGRETSVSEDIGVVMEFSGSARRARRVHGAAHRMTAAGVAAGGLASGGVPAVRRVRDGERVRDRQAGALEDQLGELFVDAEGV